MAFESTFVPQTTPLMLPDELTAITKQTGKMKLMIEASASLQRYCWRRFDERRDTLKFAARHLKDDGDLVNASTLQIKQDLKQVMTLAKDVPGSATNISEGTSIAASSYITPGRRASSDRITNITLISDAFTGGVGSPDDLQSIWIDGLWGWGGQWLNTGLTVNDNPLTSGAAEVTPSTVNGFEVGHVLKLESEYLYVMGLDNPGTITTSRGFNGSTAVQHAIGTPIYYWQADDQVRGLVRRLVMWAVEQIKSPVAGAVTLGDFTYPVDMSGLPKDVYTAINSSGLKRVSGVSGW